MNRIHCCGAVMESSALCSTLVVIIIVNSLSSCIHCQLIDAKQTKKSSNQETMYTFGSTQEIESMTPRELLVQLQCVKDASDQIVSFTVVVSSIDFDADTVSHH